MMKIFMPVSILFTCALFTLPAFILAQDNRAEVSLWENGAPGSEGKTGEEIYDPATPERNYSMLSNIHNPSITPYFPDEDKNTGASIIIAPGGGHRILAIDHEGYDVAKWFAERGIACFVLKYRLAQEEGSTYTREMAYGDASRAVRLVRSRADEWKLNPNAIGIMGFSAGGYVAAMASAIYDEGKPSSNDLVENYSSRPSFQVLIYPGMRTDYDIPADAPEAFLLSAYNDERPSMTVAQLYLKFKEAKIRAELHVFASGGHGFGLSESNKLPIAGWTNQVHAWLENIGMLKTK